MNVSRTLNRDFVKKMARKWTPWFNIQFQHLLELLSIEIMLFITIGFSVIGFPCILYLLVNFLYIKLAKCVRYRFKLSFQYVGNFLTKALCLLYLSFVYYDRRTGDNGGRGSG